MNIKPTGTQNTLNQTVVWSFDEALRYALASCEIDPDEKRPFKGATQLRELIASECDSVGEAQEALSDLFGKSDRAVREKINQNPGSLLWSEAIELFRFLIGLKGLNIPDGEYTFLNSEEVLALIGLVERAFGVKRAIAEVLDYKLAAIRDSLDALFTIGQQDAVLESLSYAFTASAAQFGSEIAASYSQPDNDVIESARPLFAGLIEQMNGLSDYVTALADCEDARQAKELYSRLQERHHYIKRHDGD